jgi:hypothetical protein
MTKREEQKQTSSPPARPKKGNQEQASARTAVKTRPLPPLEENEQKTALREAAHPSLVPGSIRRRQFLIGGAGLLASAAALGGWLWAESPHQAGPLAHQTARGDQLVVLWNEAALEAIRVLQPPMPVAARALAIVHTCMFDAWAAYHPTALGTQFIGLLRRPPDERTPANKSRAISYAAYRALVNLFPGEQPRFNKLMASLGYHPSERANDGTPEGIGNQAAQAVLITRQQDGANQLGDLYPGAYSDYTKYQALNTPDAEKNFKLWQPLRVSDGHKGLKIQQFDCPQWGNVTPFALSSAMQFVPRPGPAGYSDAVFLNQAREILRYSAGLTDEQKVIAEYWTNGPDREEPAGHWCLFAQFISQRDNHTLDQNVKLFFILANALLDTSIACWATKRAYNSAYPLSVIHTLFKDKQVRAWAGPGKEVQWIGGQYWLPYRPLTAIVPAFPEYCSEQSAFSYAAAGVLRRFTGSDRLDMSHTFPAHTSHIDPGTPETGVTLSWHTLSQAADQAGLAGRYSGTHFTQSDLDGRALGSQVSEQVWAKAQKYINSYITA